jgi:hypothetical protein
MIASPGSCSTRGIVGGAVLCLAVALGLGSLGCSDGPRSRSLPQPRTTPAYLPAAARAPKAAPLSEPHPVAPRPYAGKAPASVPTFQSPPPLVPKAGSGGYYDPSYRPAVGEHYVEGYFRRDGTYVRGHYRTNPDGSFWNNWSSQGNVNPQTGKVGSKRPPAIPAGGTSKSFQPYRRAR